jgi:EpsI family protein
MVSATRLLIVSACLAGASLGLGAHGAERIPPRVEFSQFPVTIGNWHAEQSSVLDSQTLAVLGVDDYIDRLYTTGNGSVALYVGYHASQRQGDAVHSPLNCLPGAGWQPLSSGYSGLTLSDGSMITVNRYVIQKGLDRQLVLYWYQSHGRVIPNEYVGKFYLVYDAIRLNRTDAALVRVVSPIADATAAAETAAGNQAVDFVKAMFPILNRYIPS